MADGNYNHANPSFFFRNDTFWYFWLTIQNTANWHVSNAFDLLSVFISFPLARAAAAVAAVDFCYCCCAPRPTSHPAPFFGGGKYQKNKSPVASALAVGHAGVCVGVIDVAVQCRHYTSEV
jgi:hypothetical protein